MTHRFDFRIALALSLLASVPSARAAERTVRVFTMPAGDATLSGREPTGVMTSVTSPLARNGFMLVGHKWDCCYKALLEFEIPDAVLSSETGGILRATLRVCTLTKPGCYPRKEGGGPQCDMYLYYAPEANGLIELTDDNHGEKYPKCVLATGSVLDHRSGFTVDVTDYVREAVRCGSDYLGVRLQSEERSDSAWIFQTAENIYDIPSRTSRPSLTIIYKDTHQGKEK